MKIEEEINPYSTMKPANQKKLQKHLQAVAKILYQEAETEELESLAGIEKTIRAQNKKAQNFCQYLETHRHRIVNYDYYQTEGICSIGSGAVESTIKQIHRRLKISGARWDESNVSQVLKHRCAYLKAQL